VVAAGILRSPLPDLKASDVNASSVPAGEADARSVFSYPHLWLGVLCLFVYVGVEVMAGDAIGAYGRAFGLPLDQTKFFTAFTLGAMLLGYLAGLVFTPKIMSQDTYLRGSAVLGLLLVAGAFLTKGYISVGFVASLGFANAMMWPAIFPLAIKGLGKATETGSALLVMGIAGGAIIPQAFAALKQHYNFQVVFAVLMAPCYLYILYYAWLGCRASPSDPPMPAAGIVGP
jgi:glucose/galactose transporter